MSSVLGSWRDGARMIAARFDRVDVLHDQRYEKIKRNLIERKSVFEDVFFPPSERTLGPQTLRMRRVVEWKRPMELCAAPRLFEDLAEGTVVCPGELSSGWIVSAFGVLSCVRELCHKIIPNCREQEWQQREDPQAAIGIFHFRFWRFGQWVDVVVDDRLPVYEGKLLFTHSRSPNEFWVSLLEKAYAKLLGSYDALQEGHVSDALVDMTGGISEIIDLKSGDYETNEDLRAELFNMLSSEMADHSIMCASIPPHSEDEVGERTEMGLIRGRIYYITAVKKIHLGESKMRNLFKGREKVAMVRLRDPTESRCSRSGGTSSPGKSPGSNSGSGSDYAYSTSQLTRLLSKNPAWAKVKESEKGRIGLEVDHQGEFWMPVEDLVSNLSELTVVRLYNGNFMARGRRWREAALRSRWSAAEAGAFGGRSGGGDPDSDSFLANPQFAFDVSSSEEELVIQVLQWDGREAGDAPGAEEARTTLLLVGMTVIKVEQNRKCRLHKLWPFHPVVVAVDHRRRRELFYRGHLPKGRYLLVPTTYGAGCEGSFLVRLVSRTDVNLRRLDRDVPRRFCALSCVSKQSAVWVTVICAKSVVGIAGARNVYCSIRCEHQKVRTGVVLGNREVEWDEEFVFYRKNLGRPITLKVYSHNACTRDKLIGRAEIPAAVNHSFEPLEVTLMGKDDNRLENTLVRLRVFTEDNLLSI